MARLAENIRSLRHPIIDEYLDRIAQSIAQCSVAGDGMPPAMMKIVQWMPPLHAVLFHIRLPRRCSNRH